MRKKKGYRSHISTKNAIARGWTCLPSYEDRSMTFHLSRNYASDYTIWEGGTNLSKIATWGSLWSDETVGSAGTLNGYSYYPITTSTIHQPITTIQTIIKEKEVTKEVEKRSLFRVYVVDPRKNGKILMNGEVVIAENENQAMLKAGVGTIAVQAGLELEQVDVYVDCIGTFIRPRKDTQRVKVVKEEDE